MNENQKPEEPIHQPSDQAVDVPPTANGGQKVIQPSLDFALAQKSIQSTSERPDRPQVFTAASEPASAESVQSFGASPVSGSQLERPSEQKPSKWRSFFIILGALQALGIGLFLLVLLSIAGKTGSEFIALALFAKLVPAVGIVAFINLVGLPIYIMKHKPRGKSLILGILSIVISVVPALYGAYSAYQMFVVAPSYMRELSAQTKEKLQQDAEELAKASKEITKEEAIELLKTCNTKGFYYTNQKDKSAGDWGELSTTGVVRTTMSDGKSYRLSIADRLIPELVPIAREAQKTCVSPQFWHDDTYEKYKDGKWYFKREVVNATQSGKTREEAINFMQNCKADYFVGYTDMNLVKDVNTKLWLDKAEKSTTGIEISQDAPKTYVFASKTMTAELQNIARQFRQSCYDTKKLYITVDDWIETEYPAGKWTRVKR